jgi:hypothetical protein
MSRRSSRNASKLVPITSSEGSGDAGGSSLSLSQAPSTTLPFASVFSDELLFLSPKERNDLLCSICAQVFSQAVVTVVFKTDEPMRCGMYFRLIDWCTLHRSSHGLCCCVQVTPFVRYLLHASLQHV